MPDSDAPPTWTDLLTQWRIDWVTLTVALLVGISYLHARRRGRSRGVPWPVRHDVFVGLGVAAAVWTSSGFLQARSTELLWAWTTQQLLLLLVVPVVVLVGQPLALLRRSAPDDSVTLRVVASRPVRVLGHPLIGPLLVPIVAALLFFGGLGAFALQSDGAGWALHLMLLGLGALIALPLVDQDDHRSAMAVGLARRRRHRAAAGRLSGRRADVRHPPDADPLRRVAPRVGRPGPRRPAHRGSDPVGGRRGPRPAVPDPGDHALDASRRRRGGAHRRRPGRPRRGPGRRAGAR